jgi:hypothetical protein
VVITLAGSDADLDPLSFGLYSNPAHGSLSGFDPVTRQVTYTPDPDYWGADSFQFQVDDGKLGSAIGTISLNVLPVNDIPLAPGQVVNLTEDNPVTLILPAIDKETPRSGLVFTLVTPPQHGSLVQGSNGSWTYTPDPDFAGDDAFTYTVTDRGRNDADPSTALTSVAGTIALIVNPTNDPPTLDAIADQDVEEGGLVSVQLVGQDPEGQTLSYSLVAGPSGAAVNAGTGVFTWTAIDGDASTDVTVRVSDGVASVQRTFQIHVHNVAPGLNVSGAAQVLLGQTYVLSLGATDPGQDTVSAWDINWGDGNLQTVAGNATSVSHVYALDGDYSITVTATDEDGSYDAVPVAVNVLAPNRNPVATGQFTQTDEDQPLVITLAATDPDGDTLTYSILTQPASGTLGPLDPVTHQLTYTPPADFVGQVNFMYQVVDGKGGSATASIDIKVLPVNDAPTANAQSVSTDEDTALAIQLSGSDLETAPTALLFNLVEGPQHGTLTLAAGGAWTYVPDIDYFGADSFSFSVTDAGQAFTCGCGTDYVSPALTSLPVTVAINVLPVNDAPTLANPGAQDLRAGDLLDLALVADDVDGSDTLSFELLDGPAGLQIDSSSGVLQWTAPYLDAVAVYPVTVRVSDGHGGEDQASFTVTVDPHLLAVTSFQLTHSGYQVRFNQAVDPSTLNLVDGQSYGWGASDAVFSDGANKPVAGSVVLDADGMGYTFVKTGGPASAGVLAGGNYALTLSSRADGFVDTHGRLLDGDGDGVAGGNFVASRTQAAASGVVLGLGEFTRGAGQDVNLPASGSGLPLRISNGIGVNTVSFTLHYDPSLLTISGASSALAGASVVTDMSVAGQIGIQVTGISGLTNAQTDLLRLEAHVPASAMARYGASHVLDLRDVSVNGGAMAARDDDGLHVAAYLADTSGDGAYALNDAQAILDVISGRYSGFGAYPLIDPVLVGGAYGNGQLSVFDYRLVGNMIRGVAQVYIPPLPVAPVQAAMQDVPEAAAPAVALPQAGSTAVSDAQAPVDSPLPGPDRTTAPIAVMADVEPVSIRPEAEGVVFEPASSQTGNPLMPAFTDLSTLLDPMAARRQEWVNGLGSAESAQQFSSQAIVSSDSGQPAGVPNVRFDRSARIDEGNAPAGRANEWLGHWVSGRDSHVPRKSADWRIVLPRV